MSPVPPLGKQAAISHVQRRALPIAFGSPHAFMAIVEQDGQLRLRELVIDPVEAELARTAALARNGAWMPEHYYALGKPVGRIFAEAATAQDFIAQLEAISWPASW